MATQKQIAANRRNAQLSTGPKTPRGKAVCSLNARKHGMTASSAVIPGEDAAEKQAFFEALCQEWQPAGATDLALVRQLAEADWLLRRFSRAQAGLFWERINSRLDSDKRLMYPVKDTYPPANDQEKMTITHGKVARELSGDTDHFSSLARYEASSRRSFFQALQALLALRTTYAQARPELPEKPIVENCETDPIPDNRQGNQSDTPTPALRPAPVPLPPASESVSLTQPHPEPTPVNRSSGPSLPFTPDTRTG